MWLMVQTAEGSPMDSGILSIPTPPRKSAAVPVSAGISMDVWRKDGLDVGVKHGLVRMFVWMVY